MEVALDFALQASPDHPWVTEHPEWFTTRLDGTIAYAENPPKKYQDIYPINFDNDPEGIYHEVLRILRSGSATACGSSASTTRTPSRWSSGTWLFEQVRRPTPTCSSSPRRSPSRR
jgi:starch synthase (maltosyl-transferring)